MQACVITRSRERAIDVWDIGTAGSSWYILETNYDHWKKPPSDDDRRTLANNCMKKMTQQVTTRLLLLLPKSANFVCITEAKYISLLCVAACNQWLDYKDSIVTALKIG